MKKVALDLVKDYNYLSAVQQLSNDELIYISSKADMLRNDYKHYLHYLNNGKDSIILSKENKINYDYIDKQILLKESKGNYTAVYELALDGRKTFKFELPLSISKIYELNDKYYLISATINLGCPDYYKSDKDSQKEYEKNVKDNDDYLVLDEYPFFYNGGGFINGDRCNLFLVDKESFEIKRIVPATMDCESVYVNKDIIYFLGNDYTALKDLYNNIYKYDVNKDELKCLYENKREYYFKQLYVLNDNLYIHASIRTVIDGSNIYLYKDGKLDEVINSEYMFCNSVGSDLHYGSLKNRCIDQNIAYFLTVDHNKTIIISFDGKDLKTISNHEGDICDLSVKDGKFAVISQYDMKLPEVYEYKDNKMIQLTAINEELLKDCYVARPEKITFFNKDDIEGFILKPIDYDKNKKYPCILDIHGGPKTAYGEVFFHEMQIWTSLGYFVIFCNPHCSDGRGNEFANYLKHYGATDYDDIMIFVDEVLRKYPQIDKERLGITGGSYGGYMTNWIITQTDRFKCAATQRSISNRVADFFYSDYSFDVTHENGVPLDNDFLKMSWDRSPIKYWDKVNTPTLFIQSTLDFRCPFPEALQLYSALKFRGIEARLCGFKGENHELSRSGKPLHRIRRLEEITQWMENHLK